MSRLRFGAYLAPHHLNRGTSDTAVSSRSGNRCDGHVAMPAHHASEISTVRALDE